uniref:Uncharacterized protein n=1 Tax=Lepeophtheirus salmonis TaxID=72036 RepID=A0A0K2TVH2_LEPSM
MIKQCWNSLRVRIPYFFKRTAFYGICPLEIKNVSSFQLKNDSFNSRRTTRDHIWRIWKKIYHLC